MSPTADLPIDAGFEDQEVRPLLRQVHPLLARSLGRVADHADLKLSGFTQDNYQGDSAVAGIFSTIGIKTVFEPDGIRLFKTNYTKQELMVDFTATPDLALPVVVACAATGIPGTFRGLKNLRIKETDRLKALITEMDKCGFSYSLSGDYSDPVLQVTGKTSKVTEDITIDTYGDHRMAMAFAPLAWFGEIAVEDPEVVVKSYPDFWKDIGKLGFEIG